MPTLKEVVGSFLSPIELKEGEVLLRNELSKRFRYSAPDLSEIDQIESGGADLVY